MLLLLCLLLSGCGAKKSGDDAEAAASESVSDAADVAAQVDLSRLQAQLEETVLRAVDQSPAGLYEATGLRLLSCTVAEEEGSAVWPYLAGPEGCTRMETCYAQAPQDLLWTDLDGDGEQELLFWTYGPTSGLFTVALWAYGLERGVPVCKGHTIWNLSHGTVELLLDGQTPVFRAVPNVWDSSKGESVPGEELRIPLRLDSGSFVPVSGQLPEGVDVWGGFPALGTSFSTLDEKWAETLVYRSGHCLISKCKTDYGVEALRYAVSGDGLRLSGYAYRDSRSDAYQYEVGFTPIPAPEDLSALEDLSVDALIDRLGPPHFDDGSGLYLLGWLTEDGRLLRAWGADRLFGLTLYDPASDASVQEAGLLSEDAKAAPGEVLGDLTEPGGVVGMDRWTAFQEAAAAGTPDEVTLYLIYPEAAGALCLRFDGEQYLLEEEDRETAFRHLLVSEETNPPPTALYRSATHFLLSDDPEMTCERYFAHMVSSATDPDFPRTRSLFTVYHDK